ncbi:amino acid permease [Mycolicibacterium senegalense]|uniref:amino acid permease n=1 Tax=Mycolicibacterium senegalense TaxID=1796 RepID=UPI001C9918C7|nr:amino acid permease [Mycolicibacterium senegalense]MCV7336057.1 amino acid permease [Mycolicibacterium senegalense]QZA27124.1 amino acid permease [Mycolicibacterium senegalense]
MGITPDGSHQLKKGLKPRHLTMLSLGGVIGAGLFVGSSATIHDAGSLAFVTYGLTGLIVLLVMRMLGEMAAARPSTGSFTDYARIAWGTWAGFSTGWLYWYFWVIVVGFEAVAGGQIIHDWIPALPVWAIALGLMIIMTFVNLLSVGAFGEAEYWFAGIKVVAIVAFIAVSALFVLGLWPGASMDFSNLTEHGGLLPHGLATLFVGVVVVIFSMTGVEVVTVAAAESAEPARAIRKAVNSVVFRILFFFVISTFLIVVIVPWNSVAPGESPFVAALNRIGIPGAGNLLNLVILVAVLSVLNSGLYTSSRLLFVMGDRGDAPSWMSATNKRGVPVKGILSCTIVGYGCVVLAAVWPDTVFLFLINASGAVFLFVYFMICVSELRLRRIWERDCPEILQFRMWFYPVLPVVVTACIVAVLVSMGLRPEHRIELFQGLAVWAVLTVVYLFARRARRSQTEACSPPAAESLAQAGAPQRIPH